MFWKDFDNKINTLCRRLNISKQEIMAWKYVDVVKAINLL